MQSRDHKSQSGPLLAYVTVPESVDAMKLGTFLVENHLAAGVNIISGVQSVYYWQDKICKAVEKILLAQVAADAFAGFSAALAAHHPHLVPCILGFAVADGAAPFLAWIQANSRPLPEDGAGKSV